MFGCDSKRGRAILDSIAGSEEQKKEEKEGEKERKKGK